MKAALLLIATMLAAPANAQSTAAPVEKKAERKICKPEPNSASRLPKKICKTASEWEADRAGSNAKLEPFRVER